jgi:exodeoxyribonuclease VII large subunit
VFDKAVKRPMPFLPQRVAVITSPTGAAIRDFLKVIHRRFANIAVIVIPVRVQGEGAALEMIEAIKVANSELDVDVIVLTRGGGSMEDLWEYNSEALALAIRASRVPVLSAVGHEIDITISDLAADLSAPTPSAAAELLVVEKESIIKDLNNIREHLRSIIAANLNSLNQVLVMLRKGLSDPRKGISDSWMRLDELNGRLIRTMDLVLSEQKARISSEGRSLLLYSPGKMVSTLVQTIALRRQIFEHMIDNYIKRTQTTLNVLEGKIKELGPYSVLKRGYSITRKLPDKTALRSAAGIMAGDSVNVVLAEGEIDCIVEKVIGS